MLLSLSWLREFVPFEGTAAALGDRLTMVGLELDGLSRPFAALEPIVVGHVVECGRHPEADKLSVCRVDVGDEVLDIVCGAPNVAQGQKVGVVKVGSTLPNGLTIKKAKLRGAPSNGMICSEAELGLSDDHDGILVLDSAAPIGARLVDVLGLDDDVLDISITPNRGDCLSVLGLAREVSAVFGLPLTLPKFTLAESGKDANEEVALEVADGGLCSLYHGRVIEGAATRKSPGWLRYRLNSIGVRSISNLVDVTNYILMELGQPLHAFDLDTVQGGRIIVRGADEGETLVSLDGQNRVLQASDITIRDMNRAIGLGGVMGGLNSEITDTSSRVFLECAIFSPTHIRKTARRLGLHSEAAYRFERGVDQQNATYALNRAAAMMAELSGGTVRPGLIKAEPAPWKAPVVVLRKQRAEDLLGVDLDSGFCVNTLTSLGCTVTDSCPAKPTAACGGLRTGEQAEAAEWTISTPSHRPDLTREADLIEELARIYGVDRIPPSLPAIIRPLEQAGTPEPLHKFISRIKRWASGMGLNEAINYSFVSHKELEHLGLPAEGSGRLAIMNPLSDEQNVLRTCLAPGLLSTLRNNLAQGAAGVRVFEVANTFAADAASETTARESVHLGLIMSGTRFDAGWPQAQGDLDYQDIKGVIEHLLKAFTLPAAVFTLAATPESTRQWLAPSVAITVNGTSIGYVGKVRPELADPYHAKKAVWMAELDLSALYTLHSGAVPRFAPLPVFPPVRRDITFITSAGAAAEGAAIITADAIIQAVEALKLPLLSSVRLIDCFEPEGRDEKSLTFRLTFRHADRTLKDSEADKQRDAIAGALPKVLPVRV